jgi:hypothetical protein
MSNASSNPEKYVASKEAVLLPGDPLCRVAVPRPLPNLTILIHGVNDVGEAYEAQEQGLCQGLNDRLNRKSSLKEGGGDLRPNTYNTDYSKLLQAATAPRDRKKLEDNPDAVLFRRAKSDTAYSPVIPFYWGYREDGAIDPNTDRPKYINTGAKHGEWTDRFGNRLDKDGAKGGGPFTNATSSLPDMFGAGFQKRVISGDPTQPLFTAPEHRYMVLAAKRLAMLIKVIRNNPKTEKTAINLVAHSQGCMVSLLAHALLAQDGFTKVADCIIMNHPPYSLEESTLDAMTQTFTEQQTTQARLATLIAITDFITSNKRADPPLSALKNACLGVVGENWQTGKGAKKWCSKDGKVYTFAERDNRGKVYLYFCPRDSTVALENVQGIGWKGVPDSIIAKMPGKQVKKSRHDADPPPTETLEAFTKLKAKHFYQRVFTGRERGGHGIAVGLPPHIYTLKKWYEMTELPSLWHGEGKRAASTSDVTSGETRDINAEELTPPCVPALTHGESKGHEGKLAVSAIDARIALTNDGIKKTHEEIPDTRPVGRAGQELNTEEYRQVLKQMQASYDAAHTDPLDSATYTNVVSLRRPEGNRLYFVRTESAREARTRYETREMVDNSYHSSIVGNPMHSAQVTAYDLALGQPVDPLLKGFVSYLCLVADWRTKWRDLIPTDNKVELAHLAAESTPAGKIIPAAKALIAETYQYLNNGILPQHVKDCPLPPLVKSWTTGQREGASQKPNI